MSAPSKKDIFDRARAAQRARSQESAASEADKLIARLGRKMPHHVDMAWPGGEAQIRLRLLTTIEANEATARAADRLSRKFGEVQANPLDGIELRHRERVLQVLSVAICDPETGEQIFAEVEDFGTAKVTDDELATLWEAYEKLETEADPSPHQVDPEVVHAFEDAAKKKDGATLRRIVSDSPSTWLPTLADRLVSCLTGSSSTIEESRGS